MRSRKLYVISVKRYLWPTVLKQWVHGKILGRLWERHSSLLELVLIKLNKMSAFSHPVTIDDGREHLSIVIPVTVISLLFEASVLKGGASRKLTSSLVRES